jgi:hypothetical protein
MLQLTTHVSQETAFRFDYFPYTFGHYCPIRVWVDSKTGKGQRLAYRTFNPIDREWTKPKLSAYFDLVFLFEKHGFVTEQLISFQSMPLDDLLHIVSHYYVTSEQKQRIQAYLATVANVGRTNWASPTEHAQHPGGYEVQELSITNSDPLLTTSSHLIVPEPPAIEQKQLGRPPSKNLWNAPKVVEATPDTSVVNAPKPWLRGPQQPAMSQAATTSLQKLIDQIHDHTALLLKRGDERDEYYINRGRQNPDNFKSETQVRNYAAVLGITLIED